MNKGNGQQMILWQRVRSLWYRLRLSGTDYARYLGVKVGEGCRIITRHFGTEPFLIEIGDRVTVTDGVRFLTHDGANWLVRDEDGRRYRYGRIVIGDDVFVGAAAIILPSVRIGNRSIIAAGSVVTASVPSGTIVAGVPARVVGSFDEFEERVLATPHSDRMFREVADFQSAVLSMVETEFRSELKIPTKSNVSLIDGDGK